MRMKEFKNKVTESDRKDVIRILRELQPYRTHKTFAMNVADLDINANRVKGLVKRNSAVFAQILQHEVKYEGSIYMASGNGPFAIHGQSNFAHRYPAQIGWVTEISEILKPYSTCIQRSTTALYAKGYSRLNRIIEIGEAIQNKKRKAARG